jgi:hypothetical protein
MVLLSATTQTLEQRSRNGQDFVTVFHCNVSWCPHIELVLLILLHLEIVYRMVAR